MGSFIDFNGYLEQNGFVERFEPGNVKDKDMNDDDYYVDIKDIPYIDFEEGDFKG